MNCHPVEQDVFSDHLEAGHASGLCKDELTTISR